MYLKTGGEMERRVDFDTRQTVDEVAKFIGKQVGHLVKGSTSKVIYVSQESE